MDFISEYRKHLKDLKADIAFAVSEGKCSDYADYKNKVGIIQGIDIALLAISETLQDKEDLDNDEVTTAAGLENIDQKEEA
jgi:hypothetical protein|tara:strand:- start:662 stop:904 length:243 start_codon:yes stop_codon:yes gene_type:complete